VGLTYLMRVLSNAMAHLKDLSFTEAVLIDDFIVEIVPKAGTEITIDHVKECHALFDQLQQPIGLIFSRKHGFSYKFDALQEILANDNIVSMAFLAKSFHSHFITQNDIKMINTHNKPVEVFQDRSVAMLWLSLFRFKSKQTQPTVPHTTRQVG